MTINWRASTWTVRSTRSRARALVGRYGTSEVNSISCELLGESLEVMEIHFLIEFELIPLAEILRRRGGLGSGKGSCGRIFDDGTLVWGCHGLVGWGCLGWKVGWQWGSAGDGLIIAFQGDPELRRWTSLPCRQSTCKLFGGCSCHRGRRSGLRNF